MGGLKIEGPLYMYLVSDLTNYIVICIVSLKIIFTPRVFTCLRLMVQDLAVQLSAITGT